MRFYIDRNIDGHPIRAKEELSDSVLSKKEILASLNYLDGRVTALANALQEAADILDGSCDDEGNLCSNADAAEYRRLAEGI